LDQAGALGGLGFGLGFGLGELAELHDMLVKVAASQGAKPEEAADLFFKEVERYQGIVSLELEAKRAGVAASKAKAEADRWQAEAKLAEAKAKARKISIDIAEKLLAQGVKESDLPQWTRIMAKAGVGPEGLVKALERYTSAEMLVQSGQKRANELQGQVATLESQVKALTQERDGIQAAIQAVREKALSEVRQAGEGVATSLKDLDERVRELGDLREKLGELRAEAALAHALRSCDPELWRTVTPESILTLLGAAQTWAQARGFNPGLTPPEKLQRTTLLSSWTTVRFSDLLQWAATGLVTGERKALAERPAR